VRELAAMTDEELFTFEREHHGDPYMTLVKAKGMQRVPRRRRCGSDSVTQVMTSRSSS
jgi:hypothetical protein